MHKYCGIVTTELTCVLLVVMDENKKIWRGENPWTGREQHSVALQVDDRAVVDAVRATLLGKVQGE